MKLFKVLGLQIIDERLNVYCLVQIGLRLTQSLKTQKSNLSLELGLA